jgi:hypothetical protein
VTNEGALSFQWELRRLSRRALDVFLFGTAILTPPSIRSKLRSARGEYLQIIH